MQHWHRVKNWGWFERWVLRTVRMRSWWPLTAGHWVRRRGSPREKLEQPLKTGALPDSDEICRRRSDGEARKLVQVAIDSLPREKAPVVLEHGPCRHPLAGLLASAMVLDDAVQVECFAGCGHWLYSDRGPLECPCHWPPAKAAHVVRVVSDRNGVATRRVPHGLQLGY